VSRGTRRRWDDCEGVAGHRASRGYLTVEDGKGGSLMGQPRHWAGVNGGDLALNGWTGKLGETSASGERMAERRTEGGARSGLAQPFSV